MSQDGEAHVQAVSLSLTEHYAPHWGTWEGLREICQNFYDGLLEDDGGYLEFKLAKDATSCDQRKMDTEYIAYADGVERGRLSYDVRTGCLSMINHKISLLRKVLLLGYSKKANRKEAVGQFGEGLKVGALALLRSGLALTMTTSEDHWRFSLEHDAIFDERVLTVIVSKRQKTDSQDVTVKHPILPDDTLTIVEGIGHGDWKLLVDRLLFLSPPVNFVSTPQGRLLLDDVHAGKMFVKGVFVSDLEDALAGMDLLQAQLDRDRVATLKPSEIEYQLSSMWLNAVRQKKELVPRLFDMLSSTNPPADVRHASFFADDIIGHIVADHFFSVKGDGAVPVLNDIDGQTLRKLQSEVGDSLVLCNKNVIEIMRKAGRLPTLQHEFLSDSNGSDCAKKYIAMSRLSHEERDILRHATALIRAGGMDVRDEDVDICDDPHLSTPEGSIDLIGLSRLPDSKDSKLCEMVNGRLEISKQLLHLDFVHSLSTVMQLCPSQTGHKSGCRCREAAIFWFTAVAHEASNDIPTEVWARKGIAALAHQVCGHVTPYCAEVHKINSLECTSGVDGLEAEKREESLREKIATLTSESVQLREAHASQLNRLKTQLKHVEEQMIREEVKKMNSEKRIRAEVERNFRETLQGDLEKNSQKLISTQQEVLYHQATVEKERARRKKSEEARRNITTRLYARIEKQAAEMSEMRTLLAQMQTKPPFGGGKGEEANLKSLIEKAMGEAQKAVAAQPLLPPQGRCAICMEPEETVVLMPCRHKVLCEVCAAMVTSCPICRACVTQRLKVFES